MSAGVIYVVGTIIWAVCLILNILIAKRRNKNMVKWVVLSIFFGIIALIINAVCKGPNGEV